MSAHIRYTLADPTGNITALVETPVPVSGQPAAAAKLMEAEPTAEQVGFLTESGTADVALRMAGGEFCANATMSAAVLCAMRSGLTAGTVTVQASGTAKLVTVDVAAANALWQGVVHMPRPLRAEDVRFSDGQTCPVVTFDGICHVILENETPERAAEALAKRRCAQLGAPALGLMFWDSAQGLLTPLVYVPKADTLFWENSCGSGTAAVGAWAAKTSGQPVRLAVRQPGGTLEIAASPDGALRLRGTVAFLYEKTIRTDA